MSENDLENSPTLSLTLILEDAAKGDPQAVELFFMILLQSDVIVPLTKNVEGEEVEEFVKISHDGKEVIPIFSELDFAYSWAEREIPCSSKKFQTLINIINSECWLYLNPGQLCGKEISDWEIDKLRQGEEAIQEIVADLTETNHAEIDVLSGDDIYPEIKKKLIPIIELFPEINEAFLVKITNDDHKEGSPMLGLVQSDLSQPRSEMFDREIAQVSQMFFNDDSSIIVAKDLADENSPNTGIFHDLVPFYLKQRKIRKKKQEKKSFLSRFLSRP